MIIYRASFCSNKKAISFCTYALILIVNYCGHDDPTTLSSLWTKLIQFSPSQMISSRSMLILPSDLRVILQGGFFSLGLRHQNSVYTSPLPESVSHISPISLSILRSPEYYLVRSAYLEGPHCAFSYIPLLPLPSYAQISSSAPCSGTHSAYVPPSLWQTKFHNHTKQLLRDLSPRANYIDRAAAAGRRS